MERYETIKQEVKESTKLGDLRKIAAEIKIDHSLAMKLWNTNKVKHRLLSILIMDKKEFNEKVVDELIDDLSVHDSDDQVQLMDWLFANQLTKSKSLINLILTYKDSPNALKRRTFWYYQGRLRWTGKTNFDNTEELLDEIEVKLLHEQEPVQWAMNFVAGWIGVYEPKFRNRSIKIGEDTGLYKGDKVSPGCTPNYLPEFIRIESKKRKL